MRKDAHTRVTVTVVPTVPIVWSTAPAERVVGVIGLNGMNALSKVMGFLILCIGIQFVVNGVLGIATDPAVVKLIRDAALAK